MSLNCGHVDRHWSIQHSLLWLHASVFCFSLSCSDRCRKFDDEDNLPDKPPVDPCDKNVIVSALKLKRYDEIWLQKSEESPF